MTTTTYRIEVLHLDGIWHEAGKLATYANGAWVYPRFDSASEAAKAIDDTYAVEARHEAVRVVPVAPGIPARTVLEIRADIALIQGLLDRCDAFQHDLRNEPARHGDWVVGLPKYHRYLGRDGRLTKVTAAAIYRTEAEAHRAGRGRCNGVGEFVEPIRCLDALEAALQGQLNLHTFLCGSFRDLHAELVEAQAYERHLDDTAEQERVLAEYRLDQRL